MRIPKRLLPHKATIEPLIGDGANGPVYGPPVTVPAYVEDKPRIVWKGGAEIASSTRVVINFGPHVAVNSRCTVHPGTPRERTAPVVVAAYLEMPGTPSHWELDLA